MAHTDEQIRHAAERLALEVSRHRKCCMSKRVQAHLLGAIAALQWVLEDRGPIADTLEVLRSEDAEEASRN